MPVHVRIYQPAKTAMQSGRAGTRKWCLTYEDTRDGFQDPLMGWNAQRDTRRQLRLTFDTREEAIAYAERKGYTYRVIPPHTRHITPKSYAENFS